MNYTSAYPIYASYENHKTASIPVHNHLPKSISAHNEISNVIWYIIHTHSIRNTVIEGTIKH